ncbi:MAG: formylglycine-generating enzyme family protein [Spirochaetaceae bacterium]
MHLRSKTFFSIVSVLLVAVSVSGQNSSVSNSSARILRNEVLVEGGDFRMGNDEGQRDEQPAHVVAIDSFFMMATEVTFNDYDAYARATKRTLPYDEEWGRGNRPVIFVSWFDAIKYANYLSRQDDLTPAYDIDCLNVRWNRDADGWRLPTEAEWEYAARGGSRSQQTRYAGDNDVDRVAWYEANSNERTHQVAQKEANELGLYDMSGNVWEWCWDWYGREYYSESPRANPAGPIAGTFSMRVLRGGSWVYDEEAARVDYRFYSFHRYAVNSFGFRLVRAAPQ